MSNPPLLHPLAASLRTTCLSSRGSFNLQASARLRFVRCKSNKAAKASANVKPTSATTSEVEAALKHAEKGGVSEVEKEILTWPEYLSIRKNKRRWETALTIPLTAAGFVGGVMFFGEMQMDPSKPIFNLDPMIVYGAGTLGCAGFGYLMGPMLGSAIWRMSHRRTMKLIEAKDREFHSRIVKNRVDPTAQSATNPVPDFYGEKIGSLNEYRQWLRDQARYKRKSILPED
ncbi:mitochondrial import protein Pam17 domain-containing protein [Phanerochaete sordida]|uniref:Presequence translocated-associated motor subunit PAM17 n=1 Tax=Phanerochaete sordida TaxID=48140 RepID=A0A9P3LEA9_9APHY|nr:mitochondrial import protein Pam17 domain-containing protein [Phanerochaete sordida]